MLSTRLLNQTYTPTKCYKNISKDIGGVKTHKNVSTDGSFADHSIPPKLFGRGTTSFDTTFIRKTKWETLEEEKKKLSYTLHSNN